jgi:hypothetical protein
MAGSSSPLAVPAQLRQRLMDCPVADALPWDSVFGLWKSLAKAFSGRFSTRRCVTRAEWSPTDNISGSLRLSGSQSTALLLR